MIILKCRTSFILDLSVAVFIGFKTTEERMYLFGYMLYWKLIDMLYVVIFHEKFLITAVTREAPPNLM